MKRIAITLTLIAITIGTAFSNGEGTEKTKKVSAIVPGHEGTYKVLYDNKEEASYVKITVKDEKGKIIRVDRIRTERGFLKRYDFTKLKGDIYFIELTDQNGSLIEKIDLGSPCDQHLAVNP